MLLTDSLSPSGYVARGPWKVSFCGQVVAYQDKTPDAAASLIKPNPTIDEPYIDGISITRGSPRKHVWSYLAALSNQKFNNGFDCPCIPDYKGIKPPFMGDDFFCDSMGERFPDRMPSVYPAGPLWTGKGRALRGPCCNYNNPPTFCTVLETATTDDLELRMCGDQGTDDEDVPIQKYELYIQ